MAMLDKEMAEERAELAEAELEEMRERLAAVEVELTVRREGAYFCSRGSSWLTMLQRMATPSIPRLVKIPSHSSN